MEDPRRRHKGNFKYPLEEILFLGLSASLSGVYEDFHQVVIFAEQRLEWLRKFYPYTNGIPSHDTMERVFSLLDPKCFHQAFFNFFSELLSIHSDHSHIAIDGKTMRRTYDKYKKQKPLHMVSAFSTEFGFTFAQEKVSKKSNEITAIPRVLDLIDLNNKVVTIDAMGTQKEIARKIVEGGGDYILSVKENHSNLFKDIEKSFFRIKEIDENISQNQGEHGRLEVRKCCVTNQLNWVSGKNDWTGVRSIIWIQTERYIKSTGKKQFQNRYYISSLDLGAKYFNKTIQRHWAIENELHWKLDLVFKEDSQRKRKGNLPENINIQSKAAICFLNQSRLNLSSKQKLLKAMLDPDILENLLFP